MTYKIHNCIAKMLRHWPLYVISNRSSCFMYMGKLSLYTPNTIASHITCNDFRKSCGIVNVIRYRGSTSGFSLSVGFVDPSAPYLSCTVNKHNLMTVKTLIGKNHFLIIVKRNKMKYMFWETFDKMYRPSKEGVKCLPFYKPLE